MKIHYTKSDNYFISIPQPIILTILIQNPKKIIVKLLHT